MGITCLMGRKNKDNKINLKEKKEVWNKRFGEKEIQQCPLCRIIIMKKRRRKGRRIGKLHI